MSLFHIYLKQVEKLPVAIKRWCLDFPKPEQPAEAVNLMANGLLIQGWCITDEHDAELYFKDGATVHALPLDQNRTDVVSFFAKKAPRLRVARQCGFQLTVTPQTDSFEIGLNQAGKLLPLVRGEIQGPFKIIRGEQGWLYLANDTNKSVEQFTGQLLLSSAEQKQWQSYLATIKRVGEQLAVPVATLIAPAKEMVYPQFYPYEKGELTPVEQIVALDEAAELVVYPQQRLSKAKKRSFRIADTHWSPYGAMLASRMAAVRLGLKPQQLRLLFANDKYDSVFSYGDLGNKVYPRIGAKELRLKSFNYRKWIQYDNGLTNFGRVIVLHYPKAFSKGHLVLFGSSSSYSMFDFLCRIFRTVTFIHTAGNFDPELTHNLAADFLLTQTNGRFVVRPPVTNYVVQDTIAQKWLAMPEALRRQSLEKANAMAAKAEMTTVGLLHSYLTQVAAT